MISRKPEETIMFELTDIPKFFLAFFLVLPVISLLHEAGHVFFAWLMGGKNIKVSLGTGKTKFRIGMLEVKKYYFWYGLCTFEDLKRNERLSNILIFTGGSLFNAIAALTVMALVEQNILESGFFTYQFTYFSLYYIFFALLPMPYPDGTNSDGKIILDMLRKKRAVLKERKYRIEWDEKKERWNVLNHKNKVVKSCTSEKKAYVKARKIARKNRPSRVIHSTNEEEVQNFPRIPL